MKIDIYCDESHPDLFSSENPDAKFLAIGGLWCLQSHRNELKSKIHDLRNKHKIGGEFKWTKVSPARLDFYRELIDLFFGEAAMRFRVLILNHKHLDLKTYHDDDAELGFYKFYYQLLLHWIKESKEYQIFCDFKKNRVRNRLPVLQGCLNNANIYAKINLVQTIRSEESVLIQLTDVLIGAVAAKFNGSLNPGSAKDTLVSHIEKHLKHDIKATPQDENKFNVFHIQLGSSKRW